MPSRNLGSCGGSHFSQLPRQGVCEFSIVVPGVFLLLCLHNDDDHNNGMVTQQVRIQDFGQGASGVLTPVGGLSPKFAQNGGFPLKLPENCMILKKSWG